MRRTLATGLVMVGLMALTPVSASAFNFTEVRYARASDGGSQIAVEAAPGTANRIIAILIGVRGNPVLSIEDAAGVSAPDSPHCTQASPTEVRCDATGLERLGINSGDGDDHLRLGWKAYEFADVVIDSFVVRTGEGDDRVRAELAGAMTPTGTVTFAFGSGNDRAQVGTSDLQNAENVIARGEGGRDRLTLTGAGTVSGGDGGDVLRGGAGPQTISGGSGSDRIHGGRGDDRISCGAGRDRANGGPGADRGGAGCERLFSMGDGSVRRRRARVE